MKFETLLQWVGNLPCFDFALLTQATGEAHATLKVQLSRWATAGKIIALRRGVWRLGELHRRVPAVPAELSGLLYRPSYLSAPWALAYYDLIPERVVELTAVTTRGPKRFANTDGIFTYRHIKQSAFFGYRQTQFGGRPLCVAEPEKALLDQWHFSAGEWTPERLGEMRYQNLATLDTARLRDYTKRFAQPRLARATKNFFALLDNATANSGQEELI